MRFAPVLPDIDVDIIETREELKALLEEYKADPSSVLGIDTQGATGSIRVHKWGVTIRDTGDYGIPAWVKLFVIGDYVVTSSNGKKFITSDSDVSYGNFTTVPQELFKPVRGERVRD